MSPIFSWTRGLFASPLIYLSWFFFALASVARAQVAPYRPWLDGAILKNAPSIVVATHERTTVLPSKEILYRFRVKRSLRGPKKKLVLVMGAERSILAAKRLEKILFLKDTEHGSFQVVIDFVDLPPRDSANRVDFLESYLKVLANPKQSLPLAIKKLAFEHLESRSSWVRRVIVRELDLMSRLRSGLFDSADLSAIERMPTGDLSKAERKIVARTRLAIEENRALKWTRSKLVFPDPGARRAYLADMALFERSEDPRKKLLFLKDTLATFGRKAAPFFAKTLNDAMPEVVERAAFYLGELESGAGAARLIALARLSRALAVRKAAIVALGKIVAQRATTLLIALLSEEDLHKEVLKALVAMDSDASHQAVRAFDIKLRRDPQSSSELRLYVARVMSQTFGKQLNLEHIARKKKYGR